MKYLYYVLILLILILIMINFKNILSLFYNNSENDDSISVERINNEEQIQILNNYRYIIDVRTEEEFNENHLLGAINIPLDEIKKNLDNYRLSKNSKILIYCKSGRRAKQAYDIFKSKGFKYVNYIDGVIQYKQV